MTSRRGGFTLIEILTAVTILALLVVMLLGFTNRASSIWIAGRGQAERRDNARALTDFIGKELRAAMLPIDPSSIKNNLQFVINPGSIGADKKNPDAIFWQAPLATDQSWGDIAELGYFVKWDTTNANNPRAQLCRFFVNPIDTSNYLIYTGGAGAWLGRVDTVAPADKTSGYKGLFAENVIGFWARCRDKNGAVISSFDSTAVSASNPANPGHPSNKLPASVEISLTLVDSATAVRIGPSQQAAIVALAKNSDNAADFVNKLQGKASLSGILAGVRSHTATVFLENSK